MILFHALHHPSLNVMYAWWSSISLASWTIGSTTTYRIDSHSAQRVQTQSTGMVSVCGEYIRSWWKYCIDWSFCMSDSDFEYTWTIKTAYRKSDFGFVILSRIRQSRKSKIDVARSLRPRKNTQERVRNYSYQFR